MARFRATEGTQPMVDMERVLQAKIVPGPYRAVAGDVLHMEMPRFPEPQPATTEADNRQTYNCRIEDDGTIILPMVGPVAVQGKSLAQIETAISAQYYPKYVAAPLPVYVSVLEYRTLQVSVVGAVTQPGIHALRHDHMSLVAALQQAGGITAPGAAVIRINRREGQEGGLETEPVRDRRADPRPRQQNIVPAQVDVRPVPPDTGPRVGGPSSVWQVTFVWQGPLRTTGWVRVKQDNSDTAVRHWLDIANRPQRREFLDTLAVLSQEVGTEELDTKLAQLGAYLEELPAGTNEEGKKVRGGEGQSTGLPSDVPTLSPALPAGWVVLNRGCFATTCGMKPTGTTEYWNNGRAPQTQKLAFGDPIMGGAGAPSPNISGFQHSNTSSSPASLPVRMASAVGSARGDVPAVPRRYRAPKAGPPDVGTPLAPRTDDRRPGTEDGAVLRPPLSVVREGSPNAQGSVGGPDPTPALLPDNGVKQDPKDQPGLLRKAPVLPSEQWDLKPTPTDRRVVGRAPSGETEPLGTRIPSTQTLVLPVRGLNIPFADATLEEGDTVVVEPPHEQMISVVGLVAHPGNMPALPHGHYHLIQALAFAGGLDLIADPRYVSVYRLTPTGEIVSITFQLVNPHRQQQLTSALALPLQPGDVVSVEHTPRTRTNVFLDRVFRITFGFYIDPIRGGY